MITNPYFSIIIPTLNAANTITDCIDSVLSQNFPSFELLIFDGLSEDHTINLVKSYEDHRIVFVSEADTGVYDAMNKGINCAKGKWLYFLGSDDKLNDAYVLEDIYECTQHYTEKILYGNVLINGDSLWFKNGQIYNGEFCLEKLFSGNICHQAIFYNRSVFETIGLYNTKYHTCADYDFNLKAYSHYCFRYIERVISVFRTGGLSFRSVDLDFRDDFFSNILTYYYKDFLKRPFSIFEIQLLKMARFELSGFNFKRGLYLYLIGTYHKLWRHLNSVRRTIATKMST